MLGGFGDLGAQQKLNAQGLRAAVAGEKSEHHLRLPGRHRAGGELGAGGAELLLELAESEHDGLPQQLLHRLRLGRWGTRELACEQSGIALVHDDGGFAGNRSFGLDQQADGSCGGRAAVFRDHLHFAGRADYAREQVGERLAAIFYESF